jgi:hypothetical protein
MYADVYSILRVDMYMDMDVDVDVLVSVPVPVCKHV